MYIAIAGNIGSGKTSLTGILAERTGARAYYEDSDNPYIGDFYEDMNRWSFNLQIYFLGQRIREAAAILSEGADLIQDRTIYEDAYIFASNLHGLGLMSSRDFDTYMKIFDLATGLIRKPDLLIYLKASVLHEFLGDYGVSMSDATGRVRLSGDYGDTWFEYGLGAAFTLGKRGNDFLYFDVERSEGGDLDMEWRWNAGFRFEM